MLKIKYEDTTRVVHVMQDWDRNAFREKLQNKFHLPDDHFRVVYQRIDDADKIYVSDDSDFEGLMDSYTATNLDAVYIDRPPRPRTVAPPRRAQRAGGPVDDTIFAPETNGAAGSATVPSRMRSDSMKEELYDPEEEGPLEDPAEFSTEDDDYEHKHSPTGEEFRLIPHATDGDRWKVFVPIFYWLPKYKWKEWLPSDLVASVTMIVMAIPQAMGYALVAGLEPIYGLYSSLMGTCLYGPFATSGQATVGPLAIVSLMTNETLRVYFKNADETDPETARIKAAYASAIAFQSGVVCLVAGFCKAGVLANLLAEPVIVGFTFASAILIGFSQFRFLFNVTITEKPKVISFFKNLGDVHGMSVVLSLICIVFLLIMRQWKKTPSCPGSNYAKFIPSALIIVVITTFVSSGVGEETGWDIVGLLPNGLPGFVNFFSMVDPADFWSLWVASILIALVGYLQLIAAAFKFATKNDYSIDASQELVALGLCNLIGCWFQIFPIAGVISLATVVEAAGATTPLFVCVAGAGMMIANLFFLSLFEWLPKPVLGSIVLVGILNLFDIPVMVEIYKLNRKDFICMMITILATLFIGIDQGVALGVASSIVLVTQSAAKPHYGVLVRLPNEEVAVYRNAKHHTDIKPRADMLMIRWDASIFFANAESFKSRIRKQIGRHLDMHNYPRRWCLALCFSGVNDIDFTGVVAIRSFFNELKTKEKGMTLILCKCKPQVLRALEKAGVIDIIGEDHILSNMQKGEVWWDKRLGMKYSNTIPTIEMHGEAAVSRYSVASNSALLGSADELDGIIECADEDSHFALKYAASHRIKQNDSEVSGDGDDDDDDDGLRRD